MSSLQSTLAYLGSIFSDKAFAAGRLTQMEFTYTPNYDGITLIEDPRVLISRGEMKPDMNFLIFEVTSDEAETMTRNIFGSETMQQKLFPSDHATLFNVSLFFKLKSRLNKSGFKLTHNPVSSGLGSIGLISFPKWSGYYDLS